MLPEVSFRKYAQKQGVTFVFYDKFVDLCAQKGIAPTTAALKMGFSKATPTKWKNSKAVPRGDTLHRVAAYFGVTEGELLSDDPIQLNSAKRERDGNLQLRENLRDSYAFRILYDTTDGATDADMLEAAAIIARRKEERSRG